MITTKKSLELTEHQLTQNIHNTYHHMNTDIKVINQHNQSILSTQTTLKTTKLNTEINTHNIIEILHTRKNLYHALKNFANTRYTYILNSLFLKQTANILSPQNIIELNE